MSAGNLTFVERCAAIGAGETLQLASYRANRRQLKWYDWENQFSLTDLHNNDFVWRIKPPEKKYIERTLCYPAPETVAPQESRFYFRLDAMERDGYFRHQWNDDEADNNHLKNGAVWLSESDAKEAAAAIFGIASDEQK
jgi:hypothetical protein